MLTVSEIYDQGFRNGYTAARFSDWPSTDTGGAFAVGSVDPVTAFADLVEYGGQAEQQARDYAPGEFLSKELSVWRDPEKAWQTYNLGVGDGLRMGAMNRLELDAASRASGGPTNIPVAEFRHMEQEVLRRRQKMTRASNPDGIALPTKHGTHKTFTFDSWRPRVYAHVWFDEGVARDDFGRPVSKSGEWQVILSTSHDPMNRKPRGRELGRQTFRYADPRNRQLVHSSAVDYIRAALARHRNGSGRKRNVITSASRVLLGPPRDVIRAKAVMRVKPLPGETLRPGERETLTWTAYFDGTRWYVTDPAGKEHTHRSWSEVERAHPVAWEQVGKLPNPAQLKRRLL